MRPSGAVAQVADDGQAQPDDAHGGEHDRAGEADAGGIGVDSLVQPQVPERRGNERGGQALATLRARRSYECAGHAIVVVGLGTAERHAELIAQAAAGMPCLWNLVTPMPYVQLQQMFNAAVPWGIRGYEKAVYLDEMSDGAIDVITRCMPQKSSPMTIIPIFTLGGAFSRVPDDATAFGGRRSTSYIVNLTALADDADLLAADRAWVRAFWSELVPFASGIGSYVNFMTEFEEDRVRASYGSVKYERLAAVKARYDPDNLLHLNANVLPSRRP
jgi:Berberine and berberine like